MLMEDVVSADIYLLDLWAGTRQLWNDTFTPSKHGEWGLEVGGGRRCSPTAALQQGRQAPLGRGSKHPLPFSQT